MKYTKIFLKVYITVLVSALNLYSQFYLKSYDLPPSGSRTEYGYSIQRYFDGSITSDKWSITGVSNSTPNGGSFDWMYLKLTSTGSVTCAALLGFSLADSCYSHIQQSTLPRREILAGFYRAANGYEKASWSMIDSNCGHYMSRQILDSLRHEYRQVVRNPADNFTLTGSILTYNSPGDYKYRILASQYSASGSLIWAYRYIPPFPWVDERAFSITYQPSDDTYAITGITNRFTGSTGPYQLFILKISSAGIPIWYFGYSPVAGTPSEGRRIIAMPDGGFIVSGSSTAFDPAGDVYVVRVSSTGTIISSNTYGYPGVTEKSYSIVYQSSDTSLIYTGYSTSGGTEDIILAKLSASTGLPIWFKRYPNTGSDRGHDLKISSTGYHVTGKLYNTASTNDDPFYLRANTFGNIPGGCQDSIFINPRPGQWSGNCARNIIPLTDIQINPAINNPSPVIRDVCIDITGGINNSTGIPEDFMLKQNYPNPFNPLTVIEFYLPEASYVSLSVFDVTGKEVSILVKEFKNAGRYTVNFDGSGLPSGAYFYKLKSKNFESTRKMLLVK